MITYEIDEKNGLVEVQPEGALQEEDFANLTAAVDALIEAKGVLSGILIETESFPDWESFGAMIKHFKFIKDHHTKIKKIALVTDTKLANIAETIVSHFVAAEVKKFPSGEAQEARNWIMGV